MRSALLLVDFQTDFLDANGRLPVALDQVPGILRAANHLIRESGSHGFDVVYVANEFPKSQVIANWFRHGAAIKGQPGVELDKRLEMINSSYFAKDGANAFRNPALIDYLHSRGVGHVALTGLFADQCVKATAFGALKHGFAVTIIRDAIAASSSRNVEKGLLAMVAKGARVQTSEEYLASMRSGT